MVSFYSMTSDSRFHAAPGSRRHTAVHLQNIVFLQYSFLQIHILTTTYQKRVSFHSMTSDSRVHAGFGARGKKEYTSKMLYFCSKVF